MYRHLAYLKYVLLHKWYVFIECCKLGIPLRGIIHDWTKLSPPEWNGYVYRYTRGNGYDIESLDYLYAFSHHLNTNKHHWQYWAYVQESGEVRYLPMPEKARLEMLADMRAMSRQHGTNVRKWYTEHHDIFHFHPETRRFFDVMLKYLPPILSNEDFVRRSRKFENVMEQARHELDYHDWIKKFDDELQRFGLVPDPSDVIDE